MAGLFRKLRSNRLTTPFTPFYRRYPYRNGISIDSADARGCVDPNLGFFYNRIPKAANSTMVENLARLSFGESVPSRIAKRRYTLPSELSPAEVERIESMFCFVVVRNPFTRTLSAYLDKIERHAFRSGGETTFEGFLEGLGKNRLYRNAHWAPQSSLLLLPINQFDFVGKVESLESDFEHIAREILHKPATPRLDSNLSNSTEAKKNLRTYYNRMTSDMVRELFRDDFRIFNYSTEIPF